MSLFSALTTCSYSSAQPSALSRGRYPLSTRSANSFGVCPVCHAQHVVEALRRKAVLVSERILLGTRFGCVDVIRVRHSVNQSPRIALGELQEDVCGKLICCVFLASQNRHGEIIKYRVADLMQEHFECRPHYGVRSGDARWRRFLGSVPQDVVKVLVANSDGVIFIPGVGFSVASLNLQQERTR